MVTHSGSTDEAIFQWTPELNGTLEKMTAKGVDAAKIARKLGCSIETMEEQREWWGMLEHVDTAYYSEAWTDREVALLHELAAFGATVKSLAKILNRSPKSIRRRLPED